MICLWPQNLPWVFPAPGAVVTGDHRNLDSKGEVGLKVTSTSSATLSQAWKDAATQIFPDRGEKTSNPQEGWCQLPLDT